MNAGIPGGRPFAIGTRAAATAATLMTTITAFRTNASALPRRASDPAPTLAQPLIAASSHTR